MGRSTKETTPIMEEKKLVTAHFPEDNLVVIRKERPRHHWTRYSLPSNVQPNPILAKLRTLEKVVDTCVPDIPTTPTLNESEAIEIIRKENVFSEEVTESEMDIIQKRVAFQQRQFAEYEKREKIRKFKKVLAMYDYLTTEEMEEMLQDCGNDEDEVIVRLTQPGYLLEVRKKIATKHTPPVEANQSTMNQEQLDAYKQLLKKRSGTLKKTTNDSAKKQYRLNGRLALDDAIKQVQENGVDADKAFEGWSSARIRAYQMIEQNPNSYYYRFNAPGEVQRKGQWSPEERELFFKRLEEVGANGQWGFFAMTIPGRVGYQCSNFYRLLVETGQVNDPNYVLDEKGKAHYLFDKKNANGTVEKTFRTHNKLGSGRITSSSSSSTSTAAAAAAGALSPSASTSSCSSPASPTSTTSGTVKRRRAAVAEKRTMKKRKRRTRGWNSDDDDDDDEDGFDFEDYNDTSGTYTSNTKTRTSSRRTRSRVDTLDESSAALEEIHLDDTATATTNTNNNNTGNTISSTGSDSTSSTAARTITTTAAATTETTTGEVNMTQEYSNTIMDHDHQEDMVDEENDEHFSTNPLPGFIDPITLDEVEKPAISKYGHVMGYDSWVRCLTNWEGKKNICPLTKKPLTKRDLVILTFENIEEYRSSILNI